MAYTQADVDAMRAALASGALKVKRGEEEVTYRSASEMRAQLAVMEAELAGNTRGPKMRPLTPRTSRGL